MNYRLPSQYRRFKQIKTGQNCCSRWPLTYRLESLFTVIEDSLAVIHGQKAMLWALPASLVLWSSLLDSFILLLVLSLRFGRAAIVRLELSWSIISWLTDWLRELSELSSLGLRIGAHIGGSFIRCWYRCLRCQTDAIQCVQCFQQMVTFCGELDLNGVVDWTMRFYWQQWFRIFEWYVWYVGNPRCPRLSATCLKIQIFLNQVSVLR